MPINFRTLLWLLKLGAIFNFYLVADLLALEERDPQVVIPALILLGVSAFRCLFPNRYLANVVFHDSPVSSIFLTRLLATFSEVAYIYQFSYVIRHLNLEGVAWVDGLSWLMVALVVVSKNWDGSFSSSPTRWPARFCTPGATYLPRGSASFN